jgi:hypothetical protein
MIKIKQQPRALRAMVVVMEDNGAEDGDNVMIDRWIVIPKVCVQYTSIEHLCVGS